jgi:3D (Asp-Asp-Asp) domain-containing protein
MAKRRESCNRNLRKKKVRSTRRVAENLNCAEDGAVLMFKRLSRLLAGLVAAVSALCLAACGSTPLPPYEPPLARTPFQNVRTTAYTHTESDHLAYGNHNALGTTLHAAGAPTAAGGPDPEMADADPAPVPRAVRVSSVSVSEQERREAFLRARGGDVAAARATPVSYTRSTSATAVNEANNPLSRNAVYGSAAADWSRWPAGTIFRILPTGQLYKVDDYGFALSGRNTIDLYMPSKATMNQWGVRTVQIQILQWGDDKESLRILRPRQSYRHIRRMVLELEGKPKAAAKIR